MCPERKIFDPIFTYSMHLKRTFLLHQEDTVKEVYKYLLEHSVCMEIFTQVSNYDGRYPVPVFLYKYKGNCQCKSATAKLIMLTNNKKLYSVQRNICISHSEEICYAKIYVTKKTQCSAKTDIKLNWSLDFLYLNIYRYMKYVLVLCIKKLCRHIFKN